MDIYSQYSGPQLNVLNLAQPLLEFSASQITAGHKYGYYPININIKNINVAATDIKYFYFSVGDSVQKVLNTLSAAQMTATHILVPYGDSTFSTSTSKVKFKFGYSYSNRFRFSSFLEFETSKDCLKREYCKEGTPTDCPAVKKKKAFNKNYSFVFVFDIML